MPQIIIELTTLSPSPDNYILYHHIIEGKDYFSLKSKINTGTHFTFKRLEEISINNEVFINAEELINAFNETFNLAEFVPENTTNKQNSLAADATNKKFPTVTAVLEALTFKVDKADGKSLLSDTEITKLSQLDDTTDLLKPLSNANITALALKLSKGNFTGTADDLVATIASKLVDVEFKGSVAPSDIPTGTGKAYWLTAEPGTYANHGGVVVAANEFAVISRSDLGAFSVSKTPIDLSTYQKIVDGNKINPFVNQAYPIDSQVNSLGKDWYNTSATAIGEIPGTSPKWVERLSGYADENYVDNEIVKINDSFSVFKDDNTGELSIEDELGKVIIKITQTGELILFDGTDGGFNVSYDSILQIVNSIKNYTIGSSLLVDGENAFSVEDENGYCALLIKPDGSVLYKNSEVSLSEIVENIEIPEYLAEINHVISYGQSLSVGV